MEDQKRGRLRWKKDDPERGLRAIGAGPRGSSYTDGVEEYAHVSASRTPRLQVVGWYFYAHVGDERINTCNDLVQDEAKAKELAEAWVKARI